MQALPVVRSLLHRKDFRALYSTRLVGQFGDGFFQAALASFVLFSPEREPNAAAIAVAFGILLLPYSLIGPFAGVFLDRWLRRNILVRANLLKALLTVPVIAAVLAGSESVILGISVLAVLGVGRFILAGLSASLPHVVSGKELITANALTPTSGTIAFVVGATTGLGIREIFGGGDPGSVALLLFSIGTFISAALIARTFAVHALGPTHRLKSSMVDSLRGVTGDLVTGIRTLNSHRVAARALLLVAFNRISFGVITAGSLLLLRNTFHQSVNANAALADFAILSGFAATAALIAAILTPWMSRKIGIPHWSAVAVAQASIGMAVFAFASSTQNFPLLLVAGFSLGFAGQAVKVCSDTVIQRKIPDESLGRVFSLFDMSVNVALVSGIILVALLAPVSGIAPVLYAGIGVTLALASFWYWRTARKIVQ
ncbi:MAG: MFS transporter [Actinomycetia bacterium]|nr:MFS transporter [Actinomycetes bacterium]MCH9738003.1 MFS transporter [Actinomycetes bacterium]